MGAQEVKLDLIKLLKARVDVPGLLNDIIDQVLEPALKAAIDKSPTKIDDLAFATIYPVLKAEVEKFIKAQWDALSLVPAAPKADPEGTPV